MECDNLMIHSQAKKPPQRENPVAKEAAFSFIITYHVGAVLFSRNTPALNVYKRNIGLYRC